MAGPSQTRGKVDPMDEENKDTRRPKPEDDTIEIDLAPGRPVIIDKDLEPSFWQSLISLLEENKDVFAYSTTEMPRIDPQIVVYRLNVDPEFRPIR
ncbi:hypothetical protein vseg_011713 [Gypsophila vaccaria]